eukprot:360295-Chlamydomonas_euryale.AAC.4
MYALWSCRMRAVLVRQTDRQARSSARPPQTPHDLPCLVFFATASPTRAAVPDGRHPRRAARPKRRTRTLYVLCPPLRLFALHGVVPARGPAYGGRCPPSRRPPRRRTPGSRAGANAVVGDAGARGPKPAVGGQAAAAAAGEMH